VHRMSQAPLSTQFNNQQRVHALRERMTQLRLRMTPEAEAEAGQIYIDAIKLNPGDHFLHENFAEFLTAVGDFEGSAAQWKQVHDLIPRDFTVFSRIGGQLARQRRWAEAESYFLKAVTAYPAFGPGWLGLGEMHAAQGKTEQALEEYERARRLDPHEPRTFYHIGSALSTLHRGPEAIKSFRHAILMDPDYWEAHNALAVELGMQDEIAEARSEFKEVIRLNPDFPDAHFNLAVAMMSQKQWPDAQRELQDTLRLQPANAAARQYLRQVQAQIQPKP
jgi:tetratricopeptide (TPR) repeat protein